MSNWLYAASNLNMLFWKKLAELTLLMHEKCFYVHVYQMQKVSKFFALCLMKNVFGTQIQIFKLISILIFKKDRKPFRKKI